MIQFIQKASGPQYATLLIGEGRWDGIRASVGALMLYFEWRVALGALVIGVDGNCERGGF